MRSSAFMSYCVVISSRLVLLNRDEFGERLRRDHDAGGVRGGVAREAFEAQRDGHQILEPFRRCPRRISNCGASSSASSEFDAERGGNHFGETINLAVRDVHGARPTSFTAAFAAMVPKVMICETFSRPYLRVT